MQKEQENFAKRSPEEMAVRINCFSQAMKSKRTKMAISGAVALAFGAIALLKVHYALDISPPKVFELVYFRPVALYAGISLASAALSSSFTKEFIELAKNVKTMKQIKSKALFLNNNKKKEL